VIEGFRGSARAIWANFAGCVRLVAALITLVSLASCGDDGSSSYALNAFVTGLKGTGLQVTLNGGSPISITENSQTTIAHFQDGTAYNVTISAQPASPSQICTASNPSGKIAGNNVDISINCVAAAPGSLEVNVQLDPSLPSSVGSLIASVVSPSGNGKLTDRIPISTAGRSGESILIALDANGDIVLASMASSESVTLSSDSTAIAFARLLLGPLPNGKTGADVATALRADQHYATLVASIAHSLSAKTTPSTDSNVIDNLITVTSDLAPTFVQSAPSARAMSVATPTATPPFTLVSGVLSVQITGSGPGGIVVSNSMPIQWSVSTFNVTGNPLATQLLDAAPLSAPLPTSAVLPADDRGLTVVVQQTSATRAQNLADVETFLLQTVLEFLPVSNCDTAKIASATKGIVETGLEGSSAISYEQGLGLFKGAFSAPDVLTLVAQCSSLSIAKFLQSVDKLVTGVMEVKAVVTEGVPAAVKGSFLAIYWGTNKPYGVCETYYWQIVSCATAYEFTPPFIALAPTATQTVDLEGLGATGNVDVPAGLVFTPYPPDVASVAADPTNPGTITVSADNVGTTIYEVKDLATGAKGDLNVVVMNPVISPPSATVAPGATFHFSLIDPLQLDAQGNPVLITMPKLASWSVTGPAASEVTVLAGTQNNNVILSIPSDAWPGSATVTVVDQNNLGFGSQSVATVTINDAMPSVTLTLNPPSLPATVGAVTMTATIAPPTGAPASAPVPTGTVTFTDQSGTLCSMVQISSGTATCTATIMAAPDTVTATYSGDSNYSPTSSSAAITIMGQWAGTWNGVYDFTGYSSAAPTGTLTATITALSSSTVQVSSNSVLLPSGIWSLSNGAAGSLATFSGTTTVQYAATQLTLQSGQMSGDTYVGVTAGEYLLCEIESALGGGGTNVCGLELTPQ
jgi:hypothetical protein